MCYSDAATINAELIIFANFAVARKISTEKPQSALLRLNLTPSMGHYDQLLKAAANKARCANCNILSSVR